MKQSTAILALVAVFAVAATFITGCATPSSSNTVEGPSGARLWAQNCSRCHNSRSPSDYSNEQWEVAALHMRIRANLTAEEHKKILAFLQSGN